MTDIKDIDPAVLKDTDPLFVEILATIQARYPTVFESDIDAAFKSIAALACAIATLFANFRVNQVTERKTLLEAERETLDHIIKLIDQYEAGVESVGATEQ